MIENKKGFTLIELIIAIAIIGIMMAAIVPFMRQDPGYERKQFVARLNALAQNAWQQAIITRKVHRILFNISARTAQIERNMTARATAQQLEFQTITGPDTHISWPASLNIKQFIIEGFDEMKRRTGRGTETVWFYIIPDGMAQQVTINGVDTLDMLGTKPRPFGLVLNPFLSQFKEYDTFQK